jgi:hypothetical protein
MFRWLRGRRNQAVLPPSTVVKAGGRCVFMHDERQLTIHRSLYFPLRGTGTYLQTAPDVIEWLESIDSEFQDKVHLVVRTKAMHGIEMPIDYEFHFTDVTLATMFKLAWGGDV